MNAYKNDEKNNPKWTVSTGIKTSHQTFQHFCCCRGGAGAGGEATLAVQGLPAGAERVPAEATQAAQVSLHGHVTSRHLDVKRGREDRDE